MRVVTAALGQLGIVVAVVVVLVLLVLALRRPPASDTLVAQVKHQPLLDRPLQEPEAAVEEHIKVAEAVLVEQVVADQENRGGSQALYSVLQEL